MNMVEVIKEQVKHTFSPEELVKIAREQARHHDLLNQAEEEFENVKAAQKTKITRLDTDISDCTRRITSGYEMRSVECIVLKFRPDKYHTMTVRLDNGRVIRTRKLEISETQTKITDKKLSEYTFEGDFYEDGLDPVPTLVAANVLLNPEEREKLAPVVETRALEFTRG